LARSDNSPRGGKRDQEERKQVKDTREVRALDVTVFTEKKYKGGCGKKNVKGKLNPRKKPNPQTKGSNNIKLIKKPMGG